MEKDDKFWAYIWTLAAVVVATVVVSIAVNSMKSKAVLQELVGRGVDPLKAHCAVYGNGEYSATSPLCTIIAQK